MFYFNYPVYSLEIKEETENLQIIANHDWENKTILIVEDDEANAMYLNELLNGSGLKLLNAYSGNEAIDIFDKNPRINLILMDIRLPDMNGLNITRLLKKKNPYLIIIAQTAYASNTDINECIDAGCNDYISKPIDPQKMFELINKYMSAKRNY
jgi:CheY-like chemotaxis protein